jgi:acylphosphatase
MKVHVIISGIVQGVWFRVNTKNMAEQLNVKGWVRNTKDGDVEAIFEGEKNAVDNMIKWCYEGPPLAKVKNVIIKSKSEPEGLDNFIIKY